MNDRELLELAAKAASLPVAIVCVEGLRIRSDGCKTGYFWNPLTDDGDALRLACKLGISIEPYPIYAEEKHSVIAKQRRKSDQMRENNPTEVVELYGQDELAATRRAIVRAAAEIGRTK